MRDDGVGLSEDALTRAPQGDRRLDDARAPAAPVRRRLPVRVPPAAAGPGGRSSRCRGGRRRRPAQLGRRSSRGRPAPLGSLTRSSIRRVASPPGSPTRSEDPVMKKIKTLIVDDEPLARERLASLLSTEPDIEIVGAVPRRRGGRHGDPGPLAGPGVPRRADAADERLRGDRGGRRRQDAARDLRHRLRSARPEGLPGPRARLPAQAVRPRALHRGAAARPQADRARRDRRSRAPAAGAGQGSAPRSAANPTAWS